MRDVWVMLPTSPRTMKLLSDPIVRSSGNTRLAAPARLASEPVVRVALSDHGQPAPISLVQDVSLEVDRAGAPERLQCAVHGNEGHAKRVAELPLMDRKSQGIAVDKAGLLSAVEQ